MGLSLFALAMAAFGIGTTEFVIMGLLPEMAHSLRVSIPDAGMLVSAYALGVTVGGPVMALLTARLPKKATLLALMVLFIVGNVGCALAPNYGLLMVARVLTALCHAAFFGIGALVAVSLVEPSKKARAMALIFGGVTLSNVLGVPFGTLLGQVYGWRSTFAAVALIGVAAFLALLKWVPTMPKDHGTSMVQELGVLRRGQVWLALLISALSSVSMFTLFTYVSPLLRDVSGVAPEHVGYILLVLGVGLTIGNFIGGRLADWKLMPSLLGIFAVTALDLALYTYTSQFLWPSVVTLVCWGGMAFAVGAPLQSRIVSQAGGASSLASTLNISAFNLGNATGAWLGGEALHAGMGLHFLPALAAVGAIVALLVTWLSMFLERRTSSRLALACNNCS